MPLPPTLRNMYVLCSINGFLSAPDYARPVTLKPGIITPREITALAAARAEGSPSAFTGDHPTCSEDKRAFPGAHTPSCAHLKRSYRAAGARGLLGSRTITFHGIPSPVRQAFQLEPQLGSGSHQRWAGGTHQSRGLAKTTPPSQEKEKS